MSTDIEHGYRVRVKGIAELNALMLEFRRQIEPLARESYHKKAGELVYHILDESLLQPTQEQFLGAVRGLYATDPLDRPRPLLTTDLRWVVRHIIADHQTHSARTQERDPAYDWGCHLSAIPHRTGLYVLLYTEQAAYHQIWESLPGVQEYAYWNHTDAPEGMSRSRWERRRQRWNELLPGVGIPSRVGMTIDVYDPLTDWENRFWEVKPEFTPDFEGRVRHWAFDRAVAEVWEREDPKDRGFSTVFRTQDWIKTPEGTQRWEELKETIRAIIPQTWDSELIHKSLSDIWDARASKT